MTVRKPLTIIDGYVGELPDGDELPYSWDYLVSNWSIEPAQIGTTVSGSVYSYVLNGVTRYRLVPSTYNPEQDAFYAGWDGSNLTSLIISRG